MTHSRVPPKVTCVSGDLHCVLGEGPIYDERTDTLYFVDINSSHVYAIASVTDVVAGTVDTEECVPSRVFTCPDGEPASCVFLTMDPHKLVVGTTRYIRLVDLDLDPMAENGAGNASIIATLPDSIGAVDEGARFNDGKVTPSGGHLVIGHLSLSWRNGPMGGLAVLDGKTRKFEDITPPQGIGCPNGIVWRDGKFLIVDSRDESVRAYETDDNMVPRTPYDSNSIHTISQTNTAHAHVPDGMALDTEGNLWIAVGESGVVRCVHGATGEVLREVALPVKRPTSCNFGGKDLETLFVTSRVETVDASPSHGGVFAVTGLGVAGAVFDGKLAL